MPPETLHSPQRHRRRPLAPSSSSKPKPDRPSWIGRLQIASAVVCVALVGWLAWMLDTGRPRVAGALHTPRMPDELLIATAVDLVTFNELLHPGSRFTQDIIDLLFPHLFEEIHDLASGPLRFEPQLAMARHWDPSQQTLTLELARDARWSDGQPVTAEDVAWSFQAQTSEAVGWRYRDSKRSIESVEALDPHTVEFRFHDGQPLDLAAVNIGVVLPKHRWSALPFENWRQSGDWFERELVTSGDWTVAQHDRGRELALARSRPVAGELDPGELNLGGPDPGGPDPGGLDPGGLNPATFERVRYRTLADPTVRYRALQTDAIDFLERVTPAQAADAAAHPNLRVITGPRLQYSFICWNLARPHLSDATVRRALSLAIDRPQMIATLWQGTASPASGPVPAGAWAAHPEIEPLPFDPDRARELLASRGWVDRDGDTVLDRNGVPFRLVLSTNYDNPLRRDAAILIQENLSQIGVETELRLVDFHRLVDANLHHDFDATLGAWAIDTSLDLSYAFHSRAIEDGYNYGAYRDDELDRVLDASKTGSLADRRKALHRAQEILHRDQPYTFLWEASRINIARTDLSGPSNRYPSSFADLASWRRDVPGAGSGARPGASSSR